MQDQEDYSVNGRSVETPPEAVGAPRAPIDTSDPTEFLTDLSAAEPTFVAEEVLSLRVGHTVRQIRIRTVSQAAMEQAFQQCRPPKLRKIKMPDGTWQIDENHPDFVQWCLTHAYIQVLLAWVGLRVRDTTGRVVWDDTDTSVRDLRAGVAALKASGITTDDVQAIRDRSKRMSGEVTTAETEDLLGNSSAGGAFL